MTGDSWQIAPYRPGMAEAWDRLVATAPGGTLMQSRRFLDYHGPRFREVSLTGRRTENGPLTFAFPLAADPAAPGLAVSHPGSSFGGPILATRDPAHARAALRTAADWLAGQGFSRLLLHLPPAAVLRQPDDGLMPDLLQLGEVTQLDLWSVLNLSDPGKARAYWQSEIRRAERKGIAAEPVETPAQWAELHAILADRLSSKYGRGVVHSVDELVDLDRRLGPASRGLLVRDAEGTALAGLWFLDYGTGTLHNQYNAATDRGLERGAASYGISRALEQATLDGFRRFSFGRSTNADGWTENRALLRFKARFGAGLASQFHIALPLDRLAALRD